MLTILDLYHNSDALLVIQEIHFNKSNERKLINIKMIFDTIPYIHPIIRHSSKQNRGTPNDATYQSTNWKL